jgi:thymidylate synthase (FAD)
VKTTQITLKSDFDVNLIQSVGDDKTVARAAWVSTGKEADLDKANDFDKVNGLIRYLVGQKHGTPFEHNSMTFSIYAPIFVWREFHRHRIGFSYNEGSARYHQLDPVFYSPDLKIRPSIKIEDWKPGRPKFELLKDAIIDGDEARKIGLEQLNDMEEVYARSYEVYESGLEDGFDPGLARDVLPVGIYSRCWVTCNARSLMSFLALRTHALIAKHVSYPLWEIEQVAKQMQTIFAELFPITYGAFVDNGRVAP